MAVAAKAPGQVAAEGALEFEQCRGDNAVDVLDMELGAGDEFAQIGFVGELVEPEMSKGP